MPLLITMMVQSREQCTEHHLRTYLVLLGLPLLPCYWVMSAVRLIMGVQD
jgi:hypothetical protein